MTIKVMGENGLMVSVATSAADSTTRTVGAYNKERECRAAGSLPRNRHSLFQINAEPVGHAVDIIEKRRYRAFQCGVTPCS